MDFLHVLTELRTPFGEHFFQFVTYFWAGSHHHSGYLHTLLVCG